MAKTFDFNLSRIEKILGEKTHLEDEVKQLLREMHQQQKDHQLNEIFALNCLEVDTLERCVEVFDDFFQGLLQTDWHLHFPTTHLEDRFSHRISCYSEVLSKRYLGGLSQKHPSLTPLPPKAQSWLIGEKNPSQLRLMQFGDTLDAGFICLGLHPDSVALSPASLSFIAKVSLGVLSKVIR